MDIKNIPSSLLKFLKSSLWQIASCAILLHTIIANYVHPSLAQQELSENQCGSFDSQSIDVNEANLQKLSLICKQQFLNNKKKNIEKYLASINQQLSDSLQPLDSQQNNQELFFESIPENQSNLQNLDELIPNNPISNNNIYPAPNNLEDNLEAIAKSQSLAEFIKNQANQNINIQQKDLDDEINSNRNSNYEQAVNLFLKGAYKKSIPIFDSIRKNNFFNKKIRAEALLYQARANYSLKQFLKSSELSLIYIQNFDNYDKTKQAKLILINSLYLIKEIKVACNLYSELHEQKLKPEVKQSKYYQDSLNILTCNNQ